MRDRRSEFPILAFESADELRAWLESHHAESPGMWLRIFKKNSGVPSVSFEDVLDEGLCFGWSESSRRSHDDVSYLQRFTPRKAPGTSSRRNAARVRALIREGRMTPAGLKALGRRLPSDRRAERDT
jgi:uncharacterized protein YdeI (YjbR/CyaY-like superfamily)